MLKTILNLEGAQQLSKIEQKSINGGDRQILLCTDDTDCGIGEQCVSCNDSNRRCVGPLGC